ncbi:DUF1127 domain-containing protein [Roseovarius aestuarii]|uniref:YjiS-like domain-containing protein n=1 Tax=Roseovarius aestuarii TaxID=475083 RepID=A0A1X7BM50_9RHOB|nr:DUF1127 domain-containing protein [Roseovarius aestuarii]SMC10369.1 hypothetical protein ROA7745_00175 [Roseovarius aestuarii]
MAFLSNTSHPCHPTPSRRFSFIDMLTVYRQRRVLARLDDAALDDIGLSRDDALRESRRPFWDLP